MDATRRVVVLLLATSVLLASCIPGTTRAPLPAPAGAPDGFPIALYERAAARGRSVYRIDPGVSEIVVRVYRDGALARLGHDHVVATRRVHGFALDPADAENARADLYVALTDLVVDDPADRLDAGLPATLDAKDVEGTRANMLGKVLEADRYPFAVVHIDAARGPTLDAELSLHGSRERIAIPATVAVDGDVLRVDGRFSIRHGDFGMTPFTVLGGALSVKEEIDVHFTVRGERVR